MSRLTKVDAFVAEALVQDTPWQSQARTVAELRARSYHPDNCWVILHTASGVCTPWQYDAASMAVDDGATILKPTDVVVTDPGRWLLDEAQQHNHDDAYPGLVDPSVVGNFPSFSDTHGQMQDSGYDATDFALVAHTHSATAGSVIFAGATGVYSQDNDKFFFDYTNYRLGVGKDAPDATIDSMVSDAATGVSYALYVEHKTSSTSVSKVAGTGTGIKFLASATDGGTPVDHGAIVSRWINKTPGAYDSMLGFATVNVAGTLQARVRMGLDGLTLVNAAGKEVTLDPSAAASDIVYTLPADNGDPGEVLVTDGSGVLSWEPAGAPLSHAMTSHTAGNWKVFYSDGAASVIELSLGAQYRMLMSNGASSAPTFELITNNNIAASATANIAWNKLAAGTANYAVITDASGYPTTEQYLAVGRGGTGTGSLTAGSVVFAGVGGVYSQDNAKLFWDNTNKRLGVGNAAPAYPLDVTGVIRNTSDARLGGDVYTKGATVSINRLNNGAGNRFASVDLVGDDTYTTYGARFIRENTGANASTNILHRGTGALSLYALDAGSVQMITGGTIRLAVSPTGSVTVASLVTDGPMYAASGVLSSEQYLDVTRGGTGVGSLTDHGVLVGSGTGDITALAVGTANYLLMGVNAADPTWGLLTNDNVAASGVANIAWNKLAAGAANYPMITDASGYPTTEQYLDESRGGTGRGTWVKGDLVYASNTNELGAITAVTAGRLLCSNGAATAPYYPAQADLYWDETNNRLGIGMASYTPKARLTLGWQATTDRSFVWADGSTAGGPNYLCGFGIQNFEAKEYWPSNYARTWGTMAIADGTTWAEMMRLTTAGRLQVGTAAGARSDLSRVLAIGTDAGSTGIGITAQNASDGATSYAVFQMLAGSAGSYGGQFFGSLGAYNAYGIANGVTFGPKHAAQDIGFRVGTDISGGATGPTVLIDSNKRVKIGQGSTVPLTKLHIYDENATTNNVLDVLTIDRGVTGAGVGAAGLGAGIALRLENGKVGGGVMTEAGRINAVWTDATDGSVDSRLDLGVMHGNTPTTRLSIADTGIVTLSGYSTLGLMSISASGVVGYVADGAAGKYLKTDGAGTWTWDTPAASVTAPLTLTVDDANRTTPTTILTLAHTTTSGSFGGIGMASQLDFALEDNAGHAAEVAGSVRAEWTDPASGGEKSLVVLSAMRDGSMVDGLKVGRTGGYMNAGAIIVGEPSVGCELVFATSPNEDFSLLHDGNFQLYGNNCGTMIYCNQADAFVGILTDSPAYPLDVTGAIRCTGTATIGAYTLPATDGVAGQVPTTDGAGAVSWATPSPGAIETDLILWPCGETPVQYDVLYVMNYGYWTGDPKIDTGVGGIAMSGCQASDFGAGNTYPDDYVLYWEIAANGGDWDFNIYRDAAMTELLSTGTATAGALVTTVPEAGSTLAFTFTWSAGQPAAPATGTMICVPEGAALPWLIDIDDMEFGAKGYHAVVLQDAAAVKGDTVTCMISGVTYVNVEEGVKYASALYPQVTGDNHCLKAESVYNSGTCPGSGPSGVTLEEVTAPGPVLTSWRGLMARMA